MRDKKIFLLDKDVYTEEQVKSLTEKDLEKWIAEEDYLDDYSILKIDANSYKSVEDALLGEGILFPEDYYIHSFGIK